MFEFQVSDDWVLIACDCDKLEQGRVETKTVDRMQREFGINP